LRPARLALPLVAILAGLVDAFGREGAVVAGWRPPALPVAVVVAAALATALLVRPRRLAPALAAALGVALALLAGSWLWLDARGEDERRDVGPLLATLRPSDGGDQRTLQVPLVRLGGRHRAAQELGRQDHVGLDLRGLLVVPETGSFSLALRCAGACSVSLDGHEVLRIPGAEQARLALSQGVARLEIRSQAEGTFVRLSWRRPTWLELAPLEQAADLDTTLQEFQRRERSALRRALLLAACWALGALAFVRLASALAGWRAAAAASLRRHQRDGSVRRSLALGAGATLLVLLLRSVAAQGAPDGLHVHAWTGEYMMQVVSAADLKIEPFRSLFYLHIQPPLLDSLRALLVRRHMRLDGLALLDAVDRDLYVAWAIAAGLLVAAVHRWLHQLVGPRAALVGTPLFIAHPAFLFYATFLDSTFVSGAGVTWATYELWRLSRGEGSPGRLALSLSLLFLTRSIVQWPFLLVLATSLWLLRIDRGRALRALVPLALVMALYVGKQYALFGVTITSSFGPDSFCKGLSAYCHGTTPVPLPELPPLSAASVLRRIEKLNGEYNWNQLAFLRRSFSQMEEYKALVRRTPAGELVRLVAHSMGFWLKPSSRHSPHLLVDAIPWRGAYDAVFSGVPLVLLLAGSAVVAAWNAGLSRSTARRLLGLALPCLYVAATSVVFESGENMRYKFFVEPVIWVLVWTQGTALLDRVRRSVRTRDQVL
jgi:hypothetical protein